MINFSVIFLFLNIMLILEALIDGLIYKAWAIPQNKSYSKLHHLLQPLSFLLPYIFGCWFVITYDELTIIIINSLWLLLVYIMFRISIFNNLYNYFSGKHNIGNTDLWDNFCNYILSKIKKVKYFKTIIIFFNILRIVLYVLGIVLLYLKFN
jgi:hypothetical protein